MTTYLGILVRLGTKKGLSIGHGNGVFHALLKSLQFAKVGKRVDESPSDRVGIPRNRPDNADSRTLGAGHVIQQQVHEQKVSQVVDTHRHFETIVGPGWCGVFWSVDGGVANQVIERTGRLEGFQVGDKVPYGLEISEFQLHDDV